MANPDIISEMQEAVNALERIQTFKVEDLARERDLGTQLSFKGSVKPARRLVELYRRLPIGIIDDLPQNLQNQLRSKANEDYNRFHSIMTFDPKTDNAVNQRNDLM